MNCGCLQTLLVCALATTVFSEDRPKYWHVVWTGGQSNSVGTNSQTSGYPTWPTSARIQNYVQSNSSFIPAVVPLQGEYNVGFSQVRTTSTHREIQEREERDRCKDRERERERDAFTMSYSHYNTHSTNCTPLRRSPICCCRRFHTITASSSSTLASVGRALSTGVGSCLAVI